MTTTDSMGRFRFDTVSPGLRTFVMQHDALDSAGFTGISTRATVSDSTTELRIALPSFATLWRTACGGDAPADSGFVFGSVRSAITDRPVAGALVDLRWLELRVASEARVVQRRWHGEARSDSTGSYTVCGVPLSEGIRIQATTDSGASGLIDLPPREQLRVQRRDLVVGPVASSATVPRGTIVGLLSNTTGGPFVDARVLMAEAAETRTDREGRFVIRNVPVGTRQVEVLAIGMMPVVTTIDVVAGDTATLALSVRRMTTLEAMRVTSARQKRLIDGLEERRKMGYGQYRDSTQLRGTMVSTLSDFSSTNVVRGQGGKFNVLFRQGKDYCAATIFIDGIRQPDQEEMSFLYPDELAAVEVFPRANLVPMRFMSGKTQCGVVAVWTKRGIR